MKNNQLPKQPAKVAKNYEEAEPVEQLVERISSRSIYGNKLTETQKSFLVYLGAEFYAEKYLKSPIESYDPQESKSKISVVKLLLLNIPEYSRDLVALNHFLMLIKQVMISSILFNRDHINPLHINYEPICNERDTFTLFSFNRFYFGIAERMGLVTVEKDANEEQAWLGEPQIKLEYNIYDMAHIINELDNLIPILLQIELEMDKSVNENGRY